MHSERHLPARFSLLVTLSLLLASSQVFGQSKKKNSLAGGVNLNALPSVRIDHDSMTVLYGNALIEKLQQEGTFESLIHVSDRTQKHQFRSMAYTGDEVGFRIRATKFSAHMSYLVQQWPADQVLMAFGGNEAYEGPSGIPQFKSDLQTYLNIIRKRHPKASYTCLLYTSPSPRDRTRSRMPSSA